MPTTKARSGFHLYWRSERFTTADGTPGRHNTPERCTCKRDGNHATAPTT